MAGSSNSGGDLRTPQFNGNNYEFLAVKMETILIAFDLWDVVEMTNTNPETESKSAGETSEAEKISEEKLAALKEFRIKNAKALSLIQGALSDYLFPRIRNEKTAKGAWEILKREFIGDKKVRAVKLQAVRAEFEYMRMIDGESLDQYLTQFFEVINSLKSLGEEVPETRIVQKLLMSLSRKYKSIVSIIEETRDLDTLRSEEVIASIKVYDKREDMHDERERVSNTEKAFSSFRIRGNNYLQNSKGSQGRTNSRQGQYERFPNWTQGGNMNNQYNTNWNQKTGNNHSNSFNSQQRSGSSSQISSQKSIKPQCSTCQKHHFGLCRFKGKSRCEKCNRFGHNQQDCDFNNQLANCAKDEDEIIGTMFYACHAASVQEEDVWFVDSACSNHMTSQESKLIDIDRTVTCKVKMGSGDLVQAAGKGTLVVDTKRDVRHIKEVLLVPGLDENLLSVGQMMEHGYYILFGGNKAIIFDDETLTNIIAKVIMRGNRCFPLTLESMAPVARKTSVVEGSWIWHKRFDHLNFESLKKMQQMEMVAGLPLLTNVNTVCEGCVFGKHKRKPFDKEGSWRASQPLELVHTDLCGPMQSESNGGNRYFITFIDDFSRMSWVYFLRNKSNALNVFKKFKVFVELQSGCKVKKLRSDRGGEYTSLEFQNFCAENGIERQLTIAYSPQ